MWSSVGGAITDLGDLPGGLDQSAASDINAAGYVVGHSNAANSEHAFLWTPSDGMLDLNMLLDRASDATWTLYYAQSINEAGHIVGWGDYDLDGPGEQHAPVMHAFKLIPTAMDDGDFNHNGTIDAADYVLWRKNDHDHASYELWRSQFGEGAASNSSFGLFQTVVPEPSAGMTLVGAAVAALIAKRWLRGVRAHG